MTMGRYLCKSISYENYKTICMFIIPFWEL